MVAGLQRQIARAIRAGLELEEIERLVIDPAPLDADEKAALWLYAEVLTGRRSESMLTASDPPLVQA
jgi:hypothetical protein